MRASVISFIFRTMADVLNDHQQRYLETSERLIIHSALVNEDEQIGVVELGDL